MPLTAPVLAATAFTETTLILFLHILAAMATMCGVLGVVVLYLYALRTTDAAGLRTTLRILGIFSRRVLQISVGLTGLIGLMLAFRYDAKGIFAWDRQGWLFVAFVMWLIVTGVAGQAVRAADKALAPLDADGDLATAKARLGSASVAMPVWLTLILTVLIVYLMVFQPFVRS